MRWAVVLAGGEGLRMSPFVTRWLGRHRPKQYCAFTGEKTMLEYTMERALDAADSSRVLTVIGREHWQYIDEPRRLELPGRIIEQPQNLDTAPGLYLPLAQVLSQDPEALVAVLPSDHFVSPRTAFAAELDRAFALASRAGERIVLMAARPDRAESDYGWIETGAPVSALALSARAVSRFHEKPCADDAFGFYERGWLWNTMIMVGRAQVFWDLARRARPRLMVRFDAIRDALEWGNAGAYIKEAYAGMEPVNFSRDILEGCPQAAVALPMAGVEWCDWGRPERIAQTMRALGKTAAFLEGELVPA
jgi:mannose-1-phosphate guanylyltransferase